MKGKSKETSKDNKDLGVSLAAWFRLGVRSNGGHVLAT